MALKNPDLAETQDLSLYRVPVGPAVRESIQQSIAQHRKIGVGAFALSRVLIAPGYIPTSNWSDGGKAIKRVYDEAVGQVGGIMTQFIKDRPALFDMLPCYGLSPAVLHGKVLANGPQIVPMVAFIGIPGTNQECFDMAIDVLAAQANQVLPENCSIV